MKIVSSCVLLALVSPSVIGGGCETDNDCVGGDKWKCGAFVGLSTDTDTSVGKRCSMPSDEIEGLHSMCTCFTPPCTPVEVEKTNTTTTTTTATTTKSKVLVIGDLKASIMSDTFGIRYRNTYETHFSSSEAGVNSNWAAGCTASWLGSQKKIWDYVVISLGRMDSSSASVVSAPVETFKSNLEKIFNLINDHSPNAKVVMMSILPPHDSSKLLHWDSETVQKYNKAAKEVSDRKVNFLDITDVDHFTSNDFCGPLPWENRCLIKGTEQLYPKDTPLHLTADQISIDMTFGWSTKEADMLILGYLNKALMYSISFENLKSGSVELPNQGPIPQHYTYKSHKGVYYVRKRVRVRVRVRRRVRVRVRRRVRVRVRGGKIYW